MLTSDGRYIAWAFDEEYCGDKDTCVCLLDYGPVECFSGYEVDRAEAERLMKKGLAE
ncbi:MAG: hypothetical protein KBD50_01910 [Candidatus Pacebacteria bacterium]|nr:hypothetical protein [Candidatus Paceibacterota bacterium]